jgi:hypothetical protein
MRIFSKTMQSRPKPAAARLYASTAPGPGPCPGSKMRTPFEDAHPFSKVRILENLDDSFEDAHPFPRCARETEHLRRTVREAVGLVRRAVGALLTQPIARTKLIEPARPGASGRGPRSSKSCGSRTPASRGGASWTGRSPPTTRWACTTLGAGRTKTLISVSSR